MTEKRDSLQHVNPGLDATINPIVIDDSFRSAKSPVRAKARRDEASKYSRLEAAIAVLEESYIVGNDVAIYDKRTGKMVTIANEAIPIFRQMCAGHSSATSSEQRIADAIEKLKTERDSLISKAKRVENYMYSTEAKGIDIAIALLEEVKRG